MELDLLKESQFDPYYEWLGISQHEQPPDHYRLLGVKTFESDQVIIRAAAERQTAYLHTYKIGPQSEASQRLLNEVSQAKVCLLDPARKAEYDGQLRAATSKPSIAPVEVPPIVEALPLPAATQTGPDIVDPTHPIGKTSQRRPYKKQPRSSWGPALTIILLAIATIGLAISLLPTPKQSTRSGPPRNIELKETEATPPDAVKPKKGPAKQDESKLAPVRQRKSNKSPVPTVAQLQEAKSLIVIEGELAPQELLDAVNRSETPAVRYLLYQMAIDAAVAAHDSTVAFHAAEQMIGEFEVDGVDLRKKVGAHFPVVPAQPPVFSRIRMPSGRELFVEELKPPPSRELKESFVFEADDAAMFVYKSQNNVHPEGVFMFNQKKELNGPALIIHANGRPKLFVKYAKNKRDGRLQYWDDAGFLVLLSEYKAGNKLGMTCLCKKGQPILIEEWETSQKPAPCLVELTNDGAKAISIAEASERQRAEFETASATLEQLESDLLKDETRWKTSFRRWWDRNDDNLKKLQRTLNRAADPKAQAEWKKKIDDMVQRIKADAKKESEALFDALH